MELKHSFVGRICKEEDVLLEISVASFHHDIKSDRTTFSCGETKREFLGNDAPTTRSAPKEYHIPPGKVMYGKGGGDLRASEGTPQGYFRRLDNQPLPL
jgi:hypothetical protein